MEAFYFLYSPFPLFTGVRGQLYANQGPGLVAWEEGIKERVIVLEDEKGETVVIDFGAPPGKKFDEFTSESQKLVDSVKWRGS